ncbi:MAG: hypothetical protein ACE5IJ_08125 [Thermoplasmata archaeon]
MSADAGLYKKGTYVANLGIAIEFCDYKEFRREYFRIVDDLSEKYGAIFLKNVIKTRDVLQFLPDHNVSAFVVELTDAMLSSKSISRIQAVHTILQNPVRYPWKRSEIPGIKFVEHHLQSYYPVIAVYEYYYHAGTAEAVVLDGVTGHMTQAWFDVARKAKNGLFVVPHGDETHPCISTCDLVVMAIKGQVYPLKFDSLNEFLSARVRDGVEVHSDFVTDNLIELIRAKFNHAIKPEKYYLHPLYLIDRGKDVSERIIRNTDVYALAHEEAEKNGGSCFNVKIEDQLAVLQSGDVVICLTDESVEKMRAFGRLNPRRRIGIYSIEDFVQHIEKEKSNHPESVAEPNP